MDFTEVRAPTQIQVPGEGGALRAETVGMPVQASGGQGEEKAVHAV